jgi:hypothetical protein
MELDLKTIGIKTQNQWFSNSKPMVFKLETNGIET